MLWHLRTLSKGHIDVVTGEWAAFALVCVPIASQSICTSIKEAAVGTSAR